MDPAQTPNFITDLLTAGSCAGIITDTMLTAASEALPALIPDRSKGRGCVYPPLHDIRCGMLWVTVIRLKGKVQAWVPESESGVPDCSLPS